MNFCWSLYRAGEDASSIIDVYNISVKQFLFMRYLAAGILPCHAVEKHSAWPWKQLPPPCHLQPRPCPVLHTHKPCTSLPFRF